MNDSPGSETIPHFFRLFIRFSTSALGELLIFVRPNLTPVQIPVIRAYFIECTEQEYEEKKRLLTFYRMK